MTQLLRLSGIAVEGRHGARAGERDDPQSFTVDLEIEVEATGDDLDRTADYRRVAETVRDVVAGESLRLIETLADRIATRVAAAPNVRRCRATVHKPRAAERLGVTDVSATVEAGA